MCGCVGVRCVCAGHNAECGKNIYTKPPAATAAAAPKTETKTAAINCQSRAISLLDIYKRESKVGGEWVKCVLKVGGQRVKRTLKVAQKVGQKRVQKKQIRRG